MIPHLRQLPHVAFCTVCFAVMLFVAALPPAVQEGSLPAHVSQVAGETPIAVIAPLADQVSNGTLQSLDASESYDPDGFIVNYTWRIVIENQSAYLYGKIDEYRFTTLGLYRIYLTVRDDAGNTDDDFWAVVSVRDVDDDSLPDWWEVHYFRYNPTGQLALSGADDPDGDGYTNLDEYIEGTDPSDASSHPLSFWDKHLFNIALVVAAIAVAVGVSVPLLLRRHKILDRKKIQYAIEIEKELDKELENGLHDEEAKKKQ